MQYLKRLQQQLRDLKKRPKLMHLLVVLSFLLVTFYYMTPSFLHCSTTVYGFGDSTAGPIWRYQVSPNSPLWGYETVSNYPFGDNLNSPVNYSGVLQYTLFWGTAKAVGPVCAYNVINIVGFVSAAALMYGFIFYLTKKRWIAWLAGYAVSFTPYFQIKVGGHPSYGYQALIIAVLWATLALIKAPSKLRALVLALTILASLYFDPYFSLLAATVLLPVVVAWLGIEVVYYVKHRHMRAALIQKLKAFVIAFGIVVLGLLPLAYIRIHHAQQINNAVLSARSNLFETARVCSNYPHEYFLPFSLHPLLVRALNSPEEVRVRNSVYQFAQCGIAEDTVGISLMVWSIVLVGIVVLAWEKINKRRTRFSKLLSYDPVLVFTALAAVGATAFLLALPPGKLLFIPTPSFVVLKLVDMWRVLAREYIVVNIAVIVMFALVLTYFYDHFKTRLPKNMTRIIFCIIFLVIFVEYQAYAPFKGNTHSGFDYNKAPSAYFLLRDDQSIHNIAEYPNERTGAEADTGVYYQTMQSIHKKNLFNSVLPDSPQGTIHAALKDLSDPQTVPVLAAFGIDTVVVHGVDPKVIAAIPYLQVSYAGDHSPDYRIPPTNRVKSLHLVIAKIVDAPKLTAMFQFKTLIPINNELAKSATDWDYEIVSGTTLEVRKLTQASEVKPDNVERTACFKLRTLPNVQEDTVSFVVDGQPKSSIKISSKPTSVKISAFTSIEIKTNSGTSLILSDLGCEGGQN